MSIDCVGGHTIGQARCITFSNWLSPEDSTMDTSMMSDLQTLCPASDDGNKTAPFDRNSIDAFDKHYVLSEFAQRKGAS